MASSWVICGGVVAAVLSVCALMLSVLPRRARGGGQGRGGGGRRSGQRDVRGADVAAAGQRREALHVHAEQPRERPRLGLAQLRGTRARRPAPGSGPGTAAWPCRPGTGRAEAAYPSAASPSASDADARGDVVAGGGDGVGVPLLEVADALLREALRRPAARRSRRGSAAPGWRARSSGATARPGRGCVTTYRRAGRPRPFGAGPAASVVHGDLVGGLEDARGADGSRRARGRAARRARRRTTGPAAATSCSTRWRVPASESGVVVSDRVRSIAGSVALMHTSVGSRPVCGRARVHAARRRDIGNILVANIHPCKQGDPSLEGRVPHTGAARRAP